jgi:2-polyprenyl-6-methoxyphenol hydroxylase-like FAD-dependent oxidoreductase
LKPSYARRWRGFPKVELRLGACLLDLVQGEAEAILTLADGSTTRARYVIACDGARSAVRKALGVRLDDLDFEEPWLVVDAEVDGPIVFPAFDGVPDGANLQQLSVMLCDPRRPATIVPGRGSHRRWEFMLLPGEDDVAMMRPEAVQALVAPWVEGSAYRIVRAATYRFHGLVAERWQVGRVFLAGDAAHQTPPFFGQGMCHGLRDVSNLAWKLALGARRSRRSRLARHLPARTRSPCAWSHRRGGRRRALYLPARSSLGRPARRGTAGRHGRRQAGRHGRRPDPALSGRRRAAGRRRALHSAHGSARAGASPCLTT